VRVHFLLPYLLATCVPCAWAADPPTPPTPVKHNPANSAAVLILDTTAIHALYMDGEFESAVKQLEEASGKGLLKSHADSVFAYKHLGVMYAAQYETMEKGKGYMYRLLYIEPTVKILDMYASEMIYMIFRNVQAEFQIRTTDPKTLSLVSVQPIQTDSVQGKQKGAIGRHQAWPYWTAGAMALAGMSAVTYFLIQDHPSQPNHYSGGL
jgi:hypothetical protein